MSDLDLQALLDLKKMLDALRPPAIEVWLADSFPATAPDGRPIAGYWLDCTGEVRGYLAHTERILLLNRQAFVDKWDELIPPNIPVYLPGGVRVERGPVLL